MRRNILTLAFAAAALMSFQFAAVASSAWNELKADGRVALIRHADAPGVGDPAGWKIDDCSTQRNLTERGRAQSRALGERFRQNGVRVGKLISSQWCRCLDMARLMNLGPVEQAAAFNNAFVLSERRAALTAAARNVISGWSGPGVLAVVTHGDNIALLTGVHPAQGEIVVVQAAAKLSDKLPVIARILPGS